MIKVGFRTKVKEDTAMDNTIKNIKKSTEKSKKRLQKSKKEIGELKAEVAELNNQIAAQEVTVEENVKKNLPLFKEEYDRDKLKSLSERLEGELLQLEEQRQELQQALSECEQTKKMIQADLDKKNEEFERLEQDFIGKYKETFQLGAGIVVGITTFAGLLAFLVTKGLLLATVSIATGGAVVAVGLAVAATGIGAYILTGHGIEYLRKLWGSDYYIKEQELMTLQNSFNEKADEITQHNESCSRISNNQKDLSTIKKEIAELEALLERLTSNLAIIATKEANITTIENNTKHDIQASVTDNLNENFQESSTSASLLIPSETQLKELLANFRRNELGWKCDTITLLQGNKVEIGEHIGKEEIKKSFKSAINHICPISLIPLEAQDIIEINKITLSKTQFERWQKYCNVHNYEASILNDKSELKLLTSTSELPCENFIAIIESKFAKTKERMLSCRIELDIDREIADTSMKYTEKLQQHGSFKVQGVNNNASEIEAEHIKNAGFKLQ